MAASSGDGFPRLTAEEAAGMIADGNRVGFSGFTPAGAAKAVPRALAKRALAAHAKRQPLQIRVLTGGATGAGLDDALADADAVAWRAAYQDSPPLRQRINTGQTQFVDMHTSSVPQWIATGFMGQIDFAVVEAVDLTADGRVYLSTSVGAAPSLLHHAKKVVIELNRHHSARLWETHDIATLPPAPHRSPLPITQPLEKLGTPFATVSPDRVVGVVETDEPDHVPAPAPPDAASQRIADHVVRFLLEEMHAGRIPPTFLPLAVGTGDVANAVMAHLGRNREVPPFTVYTEVLEDAFVDLLEHGRVVGASATALALSEPQLQRVYANMDHFGPRLVLRPQEISNDPDIIRRLGVIAMSTALEVDIYAHANSSHICGTTLLNGVGGSGDFIRNAYISILVTPSLVQDGRISTIVPMCTHVDHNEHSVQVVVTEQGLADLRGLGPMERATRIIQQCAHPMYRDYLHKYLEQTPLGHIRHDLRKCFDLHRNLMRTGTMLP